MLQHLPRVRGRLLGDTEFGAGASAGRPSCFHPRCKSAQPAAAPLHSAPGGATAADWTTARRPACASPMWPTTSGCISCDACGQRLLGKRPASAAGCATESPPARASAMATCTCRNGRAISGGIGYNACR